MGIGESIQKTSILTSISLITATLIQLHSPESLTLSDALIVIQVGYLTYCSSLTRMQDFAKMSSSLMFTNKWILYTLFSVFLFSFAIYVWARESTFGLAALPIGCATNDVIRYVSYGFHPIPPTSKKARIPALVFNSLGLIGCTEFLLVLVTIKLSSFWNQHIPKRYFMPKNSGDEGDKHTETTTQNSLLNNFGSDSTMDLWDLDEIEKEKYHVYFMLYSFPIILFLLPLLVVSVITIELTISWNGLRAETNKFTLGQIMALLMLIQPISDVFKASRKYRKSRAHRKWQREISQREANEGELKSENELQQVGGEELVLESPVRVRRQTL